MKRLDEEQEVIKLAAGLKVDWQQNAVKNIIKLCHTKISSWLKGRTPIKTIQELEGLVCEKLNLVFEEIWSDEDLSRVIKKYAGLGEKVFGTLRTHFDEETFATLLERRNINGTSKDRYVAVVDCRGEKGLRRFFTRWHEIAHLLTLQGQLELPLHRSATGKTPTERLMDAIAGEIGFYEPLFTPILVREVAIDKKLTFATVERIRKEFCPEASFQATLNACVQKLNYAALVMEFGLAYKKGEQRQLQSMQQELIPTKAPSAKLRVLNAVPNKLAAGTSLKVHRNMQVPTSSVIYKLFFEASSDTNNEASGSEWLGLWRHSDGKSLADIRVHVEARRTPHSIIALMF